MGAYSKILKQAYEITLQYKFLWIFGLFLSVCFLYFRTEFNLTSYLGVPAYASVVIWLFVLVFFIRTVAGLIIAIKAILDKQKTSVALAYKTSRLFFGRTFVISVLVYFGIMVLAWILIGPAVYLFQQQLTSQALSLLFVGLLIFLPFLAAALVMSILAPLFVVVYDLKIKEALQRSWSMMTKQWQVLFGLLIPLVLADLPALFLTHFMVGLRGGLVISILAGIVFLLYQTVFMVFQQIAWILLFKELIRPQKLEESQPVIAPEIAGG